MIRGALVVVAVAMAAAPAWAEQARAIEVELKPVPGEPDLLAVASYGDRAAVVGKSSAVHSYAPGQGWTRHKVPSTVDLHGVSMASPTELWVVGFGGRAMRYDGDKWTALVGETGGSYYGVTMVSPSRGAAVGKGGRIFNLVDGRWRRYQATPTKASLRRVARVGQGKGERFIAVGDKGTIVALRGVGRNLSAKLETSGVTTDLRAVAACPAARSEAVAVGGTTVLQRGKRAAWRALPDAPSPVTGLVVACRSGKVKRVIAVAESALLVLDVARKTWRAHRIGDGALRDIAWYGAARDRVIVVGDDGLVGFVPLTALD